MLVKQFTVSHAGFLLNFLTRLLTTRVSGIVYRHIVLGISYGLWRPGSYSIRWSLVRLRSLSPLVYPEVRPFFRHVRRQLDARRKSRRRVLIREPEERR
ncbi:hypothetical protein M438DRAFT_212389 [Aureobasidium pullulans EXF-150]|uniref:Uncharacterized protein n=1 Tax=Aureobasidium pullulans EXF-150 TaxID=1043002 RepID=A0A074XG15_AURPU|nr:uncharacterized protein M438DRAFT_212389 [Aureobasidium pullulans EXF-150]KEQ84363.1 hypothetical protein M438DRAFT_212389 [Aureobasidium pullulans EXF-150]